MTTQVSIGYVATASAPNTQQQLHERMAAVPLNTSDLEEIGVTIASDVTTNVGDDEVLRTITYSVDSTMFNAIIPEAQASSIFVSKHRFELTNALNTTIDANPPVVTP